MKHLDLTIDGKTAFMGTVIVTGPCGGQKQSYPNSKLWVVSASQG